MTKQDLSTPADLALPKLEERTAALYAVRTGTGTDQEQPAAQPHGQPARPCGDAETDLCLHGIPASIGVDTPVTWRSDYLGQPRPRDPEQVLASRIDELNAQEARETIASVEVGHVADPAEGDAVSLGLWNPAPPFCYLAGAAGSGKTFAAKAWAERERGLLLCATTGIAAINLGGTTINAILGYFDTKSLQESYVTGFLTARLGCLWRAGIRRLIVDEVSMLDGDQLTFLVKAIEEVNGRGYVLGKWQDDDEDTPPPAMGLTLIGDFAQLPPVKAPFAWESPEWDRFTGPNTITLTEIRRQADPAFIQALRQARVGNGRAVRDYFAGKVETELDDAFEGPTLMAKNEPVDRYNWIRLSKVEGRDCYFESRREGKQRAEWGHPQKLPTTWGIPLRLHVKIGALVMVLANRRAEGPPPQPYVYVNGDLGTVTDGDAHTCLVRLQRTGQVVPVDYVRREVLQPCDAARRTELREKGEIDKLSGNGKFEIMGWIAYMPLRVAYASTVHRSQGLSLDRVQVNIRDAFFKTPGMLYVALSRARTAEGLRLVGSEAAIVERCAADPRLQPWL